MSRRVHALWLCLVTTLVWIINFSDGATPIPENWPTSSATCASVDEYETGRIEVFDANSHLDDRYLGDERDVEYRLVESTPSGPFKVKTGDGKIETLDESYFDYSVTKSYVLTICAWDKDAPVPEVCGDVHICVTQIFFPPRFTNMPAVISVEENTNETVVYDVDVTGGMSRIYFLEAAYPPDAPFVVRPSDGKIQRLADLDYETETQYVLTVAETDNKYVIYENITIDILDFNEPPHFENLPGNCTVYEIEVVDRLVYSFKVVQEDSDAITTSMTTSPAGGPFRLDFTGDIGQIFLDMSLGSLDVKSVDQYNLSVTASDNETTILEAIVVTVVDVNQAPEITNLPQAFNTSEDLVTGFDLMTVAATDPDGDALSWSMGVIPYTNAFEISPGGILKVKSNPGIDFEMINSYDIVVYIDDGEIMAMPKVVSITITDVNESPVLMNLPATVNIEETSTVGKTVYKVWTSDPDVEDTFTYSMSVSPNNLPEWFEIDSHGVLKTTSAALLDYEAGPVTFTVTVTVQDAAGLSTSEDLTVNVLNKNEKPTFSQSSIGVTIDEELPIGTKLDVRLDAYDMDSGDNLTYSIMDQYVARFVSLDHSVSPPKIEITGRIDREHHSKPHLLSIPVSVQDGGHLMDIMYVEVTVNDIDDNAPVFEKNLYAVALEENVGRGKEVTTVTAADADFGENAKFSLSLHNVMNSTACTEHFAISSSGKVSVKNTVDAETQPSIVCELAATSPKGLIGKSTLNVTILDLNDNRPYFIQPFFSFESKADAENSIVVGKILAEDNDISGLETLSYSFLSHHSTFTMDSSTGVITTRSPLPEFETFTFYGIVEDSEIPTMRSDAVPIRVDTYLGCECLINVEVAADTSTLMAEPARSSFLTDLKVAVSLNDTSVKVVYVNTKDLIEYEEAPFDSATTLLTLLWMNVGRPDDFDTMTKTFYKADELISLMTVSGEPSPTLIYNSGYTFTKIERYQSCPTPPPVVNWWLDTPEGNFTIFVLSLLGLAVLVALIVGLVLLHKKFGRRHVVGRRPTQRAHRLPQHTIGNNPGQLFDFRYNPKDRVGKFRTSGSPAGHK